MAVRRHLMVVATALASLIAGSSPGAAADPDYPAVDAGYHSYAEMRAEIRAVEAAHPGIVRVFSIGRSYEGRQLWAAEVSDNVGQDEGEPEAMFDGLHHAREHMTAEMTISILHLLADNYRGTDKLGRRVTKIVNQRRVWIVFMVNPDGLVKDLSGGPYGGGHYAGWRKNRQPVPGGSAIGTDLNRNYSYAWGCCGGSSGNGSSDTYRGPRAWSAPEARAMRDFVLSRVVDGRQRIRTHITFHAAAEEILWPYGHTYQDLPPDVTWLDLAAMTRIGRDMARTNGYKPQQSSDLYITDGDQIDWMYARQRILSYTFELPPSKAKDSSYSRFYLPDERIGPETERNHEAVLQLLELSDCPYRALGAAQAKAWCGPFFDDLEIGRGWRRNSDGDDTASGGLWSRGIPTGSTFQRADAISGQGVLVTGRAAGDDVAGGVTTVRSPSMRLPANRAATLLLRYWVGLDQDTSETDGLEIRLVDPASGDVLATPLAVHGDGADHAPTWTRLVFPIPPELRGIDVAIELAATDTSVEGILEAAIDSPRVTVQ